MKKRTALGLVTFFSALLSGCSINGLGMVDVQHYENETLHAVEIDAWGGHLSTIQEDAGMTLGHTKRIYLYPKGEGGAVNNMSALITQAGGDELRPTDAPLAAETDRSQAVFGGQSGIGIRGTVY